MATPEGKSSRALRLVDAQQNPTAHVTAPDGSCNSTAALAEGESMGLLSTALQDWSFPALEK